MTGDSGSGAVVTGNVAEEDDICEGLAWSRALACLRRAFGIGGNWAVADIETVWERYWALLVEEMSRKGNDGGSGGVKLSREIMELISTDGGEGCHDPEASFDCVPSKAGGTYILFIPACLPHADMLTVNRNRRVLTEVLL